MPDDGGSDHSGRDDSRPDDSRPDDSPPDGVASADTDRQPRLGRVLVVDDDPGIRVVLGRALARCGYEVFLAADGTAALATLEHQPDVFAIVSDISMPSMNGTQLATEILQRHPGKPILFVTGSAADPVLLAHPLVGHIRKPVRVAAVREALAELIELARATSRTAAPAPSHAAAPSVASPLSRSPLSVAAGPRGAD